MNNKASWSLRLVIVFSLIVLGMSYYSFFKLSKFQNMDWKSKQLITDTESQMTILREYYYSLSSGDSKEPLSLTKKIETFNKEISNHINDLEKLFTSQKKYQEELVLLKEIKETLILLEKDNRKMTIAYLSGLSNEAKKFNKKATSNSLLIINKLTEIDKKINTNANLSLRSSLKSNVFSGLSMLLLLLLTFPLIKYLKTSKDLAVQANRGKSQFLANMSHEIRTPLNGIIGIVDMLQQGHLNANQRENLGIVAKSSQHLLGLINDILDLSKIEAGKLSVETVSFELIDVIESGCSMMAPLMSSKNLDFPIYIDKSVPTQVRGDKAKVTQVLVNLLSNAVKYTPTGFISLQATAKNGEEPNTSVLQIEVTDTGVGIPKDKIESIFEAFMQTDISDTRKYGGSGLGLTICRKMLASMGGEISVRSKEGKGSTFIITIPFEVETKEDISLVTKIEKEPVVIVSSNEVLQKNLSTYANFVTNEVYLASDTKSVMVLINKEFSEKSGTLFIDNKSKANFYNELQAMITKNENIKNWNIVLPNTSKLIFPEEQKDLIKVSKILWPYQKDQFLKVLQDPASFYDQKKVKSAKNKTVSLALEKDKYKILLVEDNLINQKVASMMINSVGHELEIANNGKEAVEKFKSNSYDIILMDCQMPIMGGCEATQVIRKFEKREDLQRTTIIAMTADTSKKTKEECFEAGMDEFLTKPIKQEHLIKTIRSTFIKNTAA